jgi:hypothetical protein
MARFIFRNFWSFLALTAAASEWALACWFLGRSPSLAAHGAGIVLLALGNRLAAVAIEQERHRRPVTRALGVGALAVGFSAFVVAGTLLGLAAGWTLLSGFVAGPAVAGNLGAGPLAEAGFRWLGTLGAAAGGFVMFHGYVRGHRRLRIRRRALALPALPPALDGFRIVHLSDLHVGPLADRRALAAAIERVNALAPDVVCVTGDIVDSAKTDVAAWLPLLAHLHARLGVFAILGNHDREAGADRIAEALAAGTSWHVLRDATHVLQVGDARLRVLGLEDRPASSLGVHLPALVASIEPGDVPILLCHHPDVFDEAAAAAIPLTLAGHTHGGQLAVPGLPQLNVSRLLITARSVGWFRQDGQYLHVSSGLGVSGQRVRVGMPPEVTDITLRHAPAEPSASPGQ